MVYQLSNRQYQNKPVNNNVDHKQVDLGKIATVFIIFGLLSLLTSWVFTMETQQVASIAFLPSGNGTSEEIGPVHVRKYNEVYKISIQADLASQSWSHIEGQVLNSKKQYLFSFGQELSYYSGRDIEGSWTELKDDYSIDVTFAKPGDYYLTFNTDANRMPNKIQVKVSKKRGSSLPHFWFGIFTLIIGIALNEVRNRTITKLLGHYYE